MLACARIGAIHPVVFGGFSPRRSPAGSRTPNRTSSSLRRGKSRRPEIPLKANVDAAIEKVGGVKTVIVLRHTGDNVGWRHGRDVWLDEAESMDRGRPPEGMNAEGRCSSFTRQVRKGAEGCSAHHRRLSRLRLDDSSLCLDYHEGDIDWCTADVGWVTGHSYILYGPLVNGATTLSRGRSRVSVGQPLLGGHRQAQGQNFLHRADRHPLADGRGRRAREENQPRLPSPPGFGCEPINLEAWEGITASSAIRCPVVDTWWQTKTRGILISSLPGAIKLKPGSATRPFFGVMLEIVEPRAKF